MGTQSTWGIYIIRVDDVSKNLKRIYWKKASIWKLF